MRNNFGGRLKTQLTIAFMVIITVLMVLAGLFTYHRVESVVEKQSADITQQYFGQNEYNLSAFAAEMSNVLRLLSQMDEVTQYIESGWQDDFDVVMNANTIFTQTNRLLENYDYVESVFYFGDNGVVLGNNNRENIVIQNRDKSQPFYESRIYEQAAANPWDILWFGNFNSGDFAGSQGFREKKTPYVTAACSINVLGRHTATVVVNMRESVLADMIGHADEAHRRESFLVDEEGIIIVHREKEKLGTMMDPVIPKERTQEHYFMRNDVQVNYRELNTGHNMPWTLICEVPVSVLHEDIYSLREWFVAVAAAALLMAWGLSTYWMYRLTRPLDELRKAMSLMEQGNLGGQLEDECKNELGMLGRQFNKMSQSIEELVGQIQRVEEEKRLLEKEALQSQINPHFVFNTLSTIKYMAMLIRANTIVECITALGNFLSPIYKSDEDTWPVENEITYIQNYVKIMNYRFGGQIEVNYLYGEGTGRLSVLKFILQPLVENAIRHGFEGREGRGLIHIRFHREAELLTVSVEDDGCGMDAERLKELRAGLELEDGGRHQGHVGIGNVHRRLKVYYGEEYGLTIDSMKGGGTTVCVRLPAVAES